MEYLIGLLSGIVLFFVIGVVYYLGYKQGIKRPLKQVDEIEQRKIKQMQKDFQALMNYDIDTALQRKKVR